MWVRGKKVLIREVMKSFSVVLLAVAKCPFGVGQGWGERILLCVHALGGLCPSPVTSGVSPSPAGLHPCRDVHREPIADYH